MSDEASERNRTGRLDGLRRTVDDLTALAGRLTDDDLLYQGSVLTGATVVSGGLNYAFQVFMGRALAPDEYGAFGALFAVFYLVAILGSGIRFSATRFCAELADSGRRAAAFHRGLFVRAVFFGLGVGTLLVVVSPAVRRFLGLQSVRPVLTVAATVPFVFGVTANMGALQGLQLFTLLGTYRIFDAGVKLLAGVAFVLLGYGVAGAFGALVVAAATAFAATTVHVRRRLPGSSVPGPALQFDYRRVYAFVPPAILTGFCLTVPTNVDVVVVRHFFSGDQTGLYTAASVLGKVLIFLPMGITAALFPKVTGDRSSGNVEAMYARLRRALGYTAVSAGAGALAFWLVPGVVLDLLFGSAYTAAAPLVRWYGVATLWFALAVVVLNFELARDRTRVVYAFAAVTVAEIGLMWTFHGSMVRIVQVILVVNVGLFAYALVGVRR